MRRFEWGAWTPDLGLTGSHCLSFWEETTGGPGWEPGGISGGSFCHLAKTRWVGAPDREKVLGVAAGPPLGLGRGRGFGEGQDDMETWATAWGEVGVGRAVEEVSVPEVQAELEWPPAFGKEMWQAGGGRQEVEYVHSLVGEKPVKGVGTDGEQPGEDGRTAVNDFCGGLWGKEPRCFSVAACGNLDSLVCCLDD